MKKDANGVFPYKNIFDAMQKTITNEGMSKLWVGFPTFYYRIKQLIVILWAKYRPFEFWTQNNKATKKILFFNVKKYSTYVLIS